MTHTISTPLRLRIAFAALLCISNAASAETDHRTLRLTAAATSNTTGLLSHLIAAFESRHPDINIQLRTAGALTALEEGRQGMADAVISHHPDSERLLMDDGYGRSRTLFMYNSFAIFGPHDDPLGIRQQTQLRQILRLLADSEVPFLVQSRRSGTYQRLRQLWQAAQITPDWIGYESTDANVPHTLQTAAEFQAYTFADLGSYYAVSEEVRREIIPLTGELRALRNIYSYIVLDPEQVPGSNAALAGRFRDFLISQEGQRLIADFGAEHFPVALYSPAAHLDAELQEQRAQHQIHQQQHYLWLLTGAIILTLFLTLVIARLYRLNQRLTENLRTHTERLEMAANGSQEGIFDWHIEERHLYCSPLASRLLGNPKVIPDSLKTLFSQVLGILEAERIHKELVGYLKNAEQEYFDTELHLGQHWLHLRGKAQRDEEGHALRMSGSIRDVTESREYGRLLRQQSLHDPLTDLPTRRLLLDRLDQLIKQCNREQESFCLLTLDIAGFKQINESFGYQTGDQVLKAVATRLHKLLRNSDTVARLSGDEFAIILPGVAERSCRDTVDKLLNGLRRPFHATSHRLHLTCAIGGALYPDHGSNSGDLLKHAEVAMFHAKERHQQLAIYDAGKDPNSIRKITLEADLRSAIAEDRLALHYQPKVDLASRRTIGAEGLLRWHHPQHGPVSPVEFIPLAERTGLIHDITRWVIGEAVRQCRIWQGHGLHLPISINLSLHDLDDPSLVAHISHLLEENPGIRGMLEFEITESTMMQDPERTQDNLQKLKSLGIRLAIDDFGTGFSSLSYLATFPVDALKIDKSFVLRQQRSTADRSIVCSTIELAHQLGMQAVAEGVEDEDSLQMLVEAGCDLAQGFHIAQSMPPYTLEEWLKQCPWPLPDSPMASGSQRA